MIGCLKLNCSRHRTTKEESQHNPEKLGYTDVRAGAVRGNSPGGDALTADDVNCNKCVGKKDLANKAVTGKKIKKKAVTNKKIDKNTIKSNRIKDETIEMKDLSDGVLGAISTVNVVDAQNKVVAPGRNSIVG